MDKFFWQPWNQAAKNCLQNNTHLNEGLNWVNRSISVNENFTNLRVKSGLLEKKGQKEQADQILAKAMSLATEGELNQYGYQLLFSGKVDEAIIMFQKNVKDHLIPGMYMTAWVKGMQPKVIIKKLSDIIAKPSTW